MIEWFGTPKGVLVVNALDVACKAFFTLASLAALAALILPEKLKKINYPPEDGTGSRRPC